MVGADVPGGPRPPRASPAVSPLASPCARRAGDVAPDQMTRWWGMVGADVPAARVPEDVPVDVPVGVPVGAARRGRRALPWGAVVGHGRGRRPGGPRSRWCPRWRLRARGAPGTSRPTRCARRWGMVGADVPGGPRPPRASPAVSPLASPCARRAGDVAPDQMTRWWGMVGADVPAARVPEDVPVDVPVGVPVGAARRGRRALPWGAVVGHGRGRRPGGPRPPRASPLTSPAARVPEGVPVDVPVGAARRGRRALPWGAVVGHGRGRRPRRPASLA